MYDHTKQYRCTIIRGKSQKEMDDLLPIYALVIDTVCPCKEADFENSFNNEFRKYRPDSAGTKKTLDNHRTEIAGKLFGMYYTSDDGVVYESDRTKKYLADNDQPAFFKDICYKMQFPNGMQKPNTVQKRMNDLIVLRPNAFMLQLLLMAREVHIDISKKEMGYYVLNSLDVLQGNAKPEEVLTEIMKAHLQGVERTINVPGKADSYCYQHVNEQINYLVLANLIRVTDDNEKRIYLNMRELETIKLFANEWDKPLLFNVYSFDLSTVENRKIFELKWQEYYGRLSDVAGRFETKVSALIEDEDKKPDVIKDGEERPQSLTEFGDEGEAVVYEYEKERVAKFNQRLVQKVIPFGKQKGIGYDIQSVVAEPGEKSEFVKYIEVKSTKRVTTPNIDSDNWTDSVNITRNEWIAAKQHKESYSIYRLYFTRDGITAFVLNNIEEKERDGKLNIVPLTYKIDFGKDSVDNVIPMKE